MFQSQRKMCALGSFCLGFLLILCVQASPTKQRVVNLGGEKRGVDVLVECADRCLPKDQIKDYDILLHNEHDEQLSYYYSDRKLCEHACKFVDTSEPELLNNILRGECTVTSIEGLPNGFRISQNMSKFHPLRKPAGLRNPYLSFSPSINENVTIGSELLTCALTTNGTPEITTPIPTPLGENSSQTQLFSDIPITPKGFRFTIRLGVITALNSKTTESSNDSNNNTGTLLLLKSVLENIAVLTSQVFKEPSESLGLGLDSPANEKPLRNHNLTGSTFSSKVSRITEEVTAKSQLIPLHQSEQKNTLPVIKNESNRTNAVQDASSFKAQHSLKFVSNTTTVSGKESQTNYSKTTPTSSPTGGISSVSSNIVSYTTFHRTHPSGNEKNTTDIKLRNSNRSFFNDSTDIESLINCDQTQNEPHWSVKKMNYLPSQINFNRSINEPEFEDVEGKVTGNSTRDKRDLGSAHSSTISNISSDGIPIDQSSILVGHLQGGLVVPIAAVSNVTDVSNSNSTTVGNSSNQSSILPGPHQVGLVFPFAVVSNVTDFSTYNSTAVGNGSNQSSMLPGHLKVGLAVPIL